MSCGKPDSPSNGQVLGTLFTFGADVQFTCNAGFQLRGSDRSTCRVSGWDANTPTCEGKYHIHTKHLMVECGGAMVRASAFSCKGCEFH